MKEYSRYQLVNLRILVLFQIDQFYDRLVIQIDYYVVHCDVLQIHSQLELLIDEGIEAVIHYFEVRVLVEVVVVMHQIKNVKLFCDLENRCHYFSLLLVGCFLPVEILQRGRVDFLVF